MLRKLESRYGLGDLRVDESLDLSEQGRDKIISSRLGSTWAQGEGLTLASRSPSFSSRGLSLGFWDFEPPPSGAARSLLAPTVPKTERGRVGGASVSRWP